MSTTIYVQTFVWDGPVIEKDGAFYIGEGAGAWRDEKTGEVVDPLASAASAHRRVDIAADLYNRAYPRRPIVIRRLAGPYVT